MSWRLIKSLVCLRSQKGRAVPHHSRVSAETIRAAAHPLRSVTHRAWVRDGTVGVVTALDITRDPFNGWIMYL
jgi:hypothetical protein